MTPAENYAQKRLEAEELIRQHAPARLQERLIALLRPAIALNATRADDEQIAVGASKFGGSPDVPEDFEWPMWDGRPLGFVAQINLAEVAPFDSGNLLPKRGFLWFFLSLDEENPVYGPPEQFEGWKVLFGNEPLHRIEAPENSHWIVPMLTQRVVIEPSWSLDESASELFDWAEDSWEEEWSEFQLEVLEKCPYRMLTAPYAPQLSPSIVAANGSRGKSGYDLYIDSSSTEEWELLLQIDTCTTEFFEDIHDLGWLYFMIRREDLKNADFSRVWFNEQCT